MNIDIWQIIQRDLNRWPAPGLCRWWISTPWYRRRQPSRGLGGGPDRERGCSGGKGGGARAHGRCSRRCRRGGDGRAPHQSRSSRCRGRGLCTELSLSLLHRLTPDYGLQNHLVQVVYLARRFRRLGGQGAGWPQGAARAGLARGGELG